MSTQDLVETWERETFEKGIEKGIKKGIAQSLLDLYEARFGLVPDVVRSHVAETHDEPLLRAWLKLVALGSTEEIARAPR